MGFFSFLGTKKQESASEAPGFTSRSEEESRAHRNRSTRSKKQPDGATHASSDTALPEKKRARRRLVGAIALVLAAIIGLPMLLDSEQKSVPDDIAIEIPSPDIPAAPIAPVVPAPPTGASSSGSVSAAAGLSQQEEIIDPEPAPAIAPAPVVAAAPQPTVEIRPAPKPEPRHEPKPEFKPEPRPEPKPEPRQAAKADEAARARAILEGRTDTVAAEKTSTKFTLQIAALATQEKVNELQGRLKDAGIKSYTQKIATGSGSRIRVRVGPFASKEEAEKMRAKLVKLGFGGTLVPVS